MKAYREYICTDCNEEIKVNDEFFALEGRNDDKKFCSPECLDSYHFGNGICKKCEIFAKLDDDKLCDKCKREIRKEIEREERFLKSLDSKNKKAEGKETIGTIEIKDTNNDKSINYWFYFFFIIIFLIIGWSVWKLLRNNEEDKKNS